MNQNQSTPMSVDEFKTLLESDQWERHVSFERGQEDIMHDQDEKPYSQDGWATITSKLGKQSVVYQMACYQQEDQDTVFIDPDNVNFTFYNISVKGDDDVEFNALDMENYLPESFVTLTQEEVLSIEYPRQ